MSSLATDPPMTKREKIIRIDRAITLYGMHFVQKSLPTKGTHRVPILMYHSVTDQPQSEMQSYYKTNISPTLFEQQIQFLVANNYKIISLQQFEQSPKKTENPNEKTVIITFDDGYENWYTHAFPILQKYNAVATMFLTTSYINKKNKTIAGNSYLNWEQVREMQAYGISFGSHTVNHLQLDTMSYEEVEYELRESKQTLENQLQRSVTTFSYPFAFPETKIAFRERLEHILKQCGYTHGVTTILGTNNAQDDPLFLKRLPVNQDDDLQLFQAKLQGSYDWLRVIQTIVKRIKTLSHASRKVVELGSLWSLNHAVWV